MMKNRIYAALAAAMVLMLCSGACLAQKEQKTVYAFGYATCLGDSAVYLSTIQVLDGAQLQDKTDFLLHCRDYAAQMERQLSAQYGEHFTCAVFYAESRSKLEKKFLKLRRRLTADKGTSLTELPAATFQFSPVAGAVVTAH